MILKGGAGFIIHRSRPPPHSCRPDAPLIWLHFTGEVSTPAQHPRMHSGTYLLTIIGLCAFCGCPLPANATLEAATINPAKRKALSGTLLLKIIIILIVEKGEQRLKHRPGQERSLRVVRREWQQGRRNPFGRRGRSLNGGAGKDNEDLAPTVSSPSPFRSHAPKRSFSNWLTMNMHLPQRSNVC